MRYIIVLLGLLYVVDGRNLHERSQDQDEALDEKNDFIKSIRDHANSQMRHRKTRRTYDYYDPNYDIMRDYSRHQDETLNKIERLLDEISWYVRKPQAPPQLAPSPQPQIVYFPYPVPYPVPQYINTRNCHNAPNLTVKWPVMDDVNQNWGLIPGDTGKDIDVGNDGSRPVSFDVIPPEEPIPNPPPVEHGSSQAGTRRTAAPVSIPSICHAAILLCCGLDTKSDQQNCFLKYKCPKTFSTGLSCKPEIIKKVVEIYEKAYAINN